jgi:hypothetical protein
MQARILRSCLDGIPQGALTLNVSPETVVEIGKVDRGRREVGAQPQRGCVFGFRFSCEPAPGIEICQRGPGLRPIGIEALNGDEFGRGALETVAVGGR